MHSRDVLDWVRRVLGDGLVALTFAAGVAVVVSSCGSGEEPSVVTAGQFAESGTRAEFVEQVMPLLESDPSAVETKLVELLPDLPVADYGPGPFEVFDFSVSLSQEGDGYEATWRTVIQTQESAELVIERLEDTAIDAFSFVETESKTGDSLLGDTEVTDVSVRFVSDSEAEDKVTFIVKTESDRTVTQITTVRRAPLDESNLPDFMANYSGWLSAYPIGAELEVRELRISRAFQSFTLFVPPIDFSLVLASPDSQVKAPAMLADFEERAIPQGWVKTRTDDRDNFFTHPDGYEVLIVTDGPELKVSTEVELTEQ